MKQGQNAGSVRAQGCGRGFTLIELLVVISIIAVLISLLMPSLSSSRLLARAVMCSGNERGVYLGFTGYAISNKDYVPGIGFGPTWVVALGKDGHLGPAESTRIAMIDARLMGPPYLYNDDRYKVLNDPGEPVFTSITPSQEPYWSGVAYTNYTNYYIKSSYAISWSVNFGPSGGAWYSDRKGFSNPTAPGQKPSNSAILAEGRGFDIGWYNNDFSYHVDIPYPDYTTQMHAFSHPNETSNVLYLDGAVRQMRPGWKTGIPVWTYIWQ